MRAYSVSELSEWLSYLISVYYKVCINTTISQQNIPRLWNSKGLLKVHKDQQGTELEYRFALFFSSILYWNNFFYTPIIKQIKHFHSKEYLRIVLKDKQAFSQSLGLFEGVTEKHNLEIPHTHLSMYKMPPYLRWPLLF